MLNFYKCYRANVRGKVESLHSATAGAGESERKESFQKASNYFRLALRYAVAGSEPLILIVMGRIASGKSTLARALGDELDWLVISSDRVRKQIAGVPLHKRSDEAVRSRLYSASMTAKTYRRLLIDAVNVARSGRCAIVDATFSSREQRRKWRDLLNRRRIRFRFIEVTASSRVVKERLRARERKADEVSDARLEDFDTLTARYESPTELAASGLISVRSSPRKNLVAETLQKLVRCHLD